jgi:hypothetical protein
MPGLHGISLRSCPNLNGDQMINLIIYITRLSAPRPLALRYIALLGAPLFPLNQPSRYAPVIVATASDEILTDLHGMQCLGKDHLESDIINRRWSLKEKYPNHPCVECHARQELCMKCHVRKTCVGCLSFYCDTCEPHPEVPPIPQDYADSFQKLKIGCHECGRLCEMCRNGIMLVCTWCSGRFCGIHEPLEVGRKILCEWCRNAGRRTTELY